MDRFLMTHVIIVAFSMLYIATGLPVRRHDPYTSAESLYQPMRGMSSFPLYRDPYGSVIVQRVDRPVLRSSMPSSGRRRVAEIFRAASVGPFIASEIHGRQRDRTHQTRSAAPIRYRIDHDYIPPGNNFDPTRQRRIHRDGLGGSAIQDPNYFQEFSSPLYRDIRRGSSTGQTRGFPPYDTGVQRFGSGTENFGAYALAMTDPEALNRDMFSPLNTEGFTAEGMRNSELSSRNSVSEAFLNRNALPGAELLLNPVDAVRMEHLAESFGAEGVSISRGLQVPETTKIATSLQHNHDVSLDMYAKGNPSNRPMAVINGDLSSNAYNSINDSKALSNRSTTVGLGKAKTIKGNTASLLKDQSITGESYIERITPLALSETQDKAQLEKASLKHQHIKMSKSSTRESKLGQKFNKSSASTELISKPSDVIYANKKVDISDIKTDIRNIRKKASTKNQINKKRSKAAQNQDLSKKPKNITPGKSLSNTQGDTKIKIESYAAEWSKILREVFKQTHLNEKASMERQGIANKGGVSNRNTRKGIEKIGDKTKVSSFQQTNLPAPSLIGLDVLDVPVQQNKESSKKVRQKSNSQRSPKAGRHAFDTVKSSTRKQDHKDSPPIINIVQIGETLSSGNAKLSSLTPDLLPSRDQNPTNKLRTAAIKSTSDAKDIRTRERSFLVETANTQQLSSKTIHKARVNQHLPSHTRETIPGDASIGKQSNFDGILEKENNALKSIKNSTLNVKTSDNLSAPKAVVLSNTTISQVKPDSVGSPPLVTKSDIKSSNNMGTSFPDASELKLGMSLSKTTLAKATDVRNTGTSGNSVVDKDNSAQTFLQKAVAFFKNAQAIETQQGGTGYVFLMLDKGSLTANTSEQLVARSGIRKIFHLGSSGNTSESRNSKSMNTKTEKSSVPENMSATKMLNKSKKTAANDVGKQTSVITDKVNAQPLADVELTDIQSPSSDAKTKKSSVPENMSATKMINKAKKTVANDVGKQTSVITDKVNTQPLADVELTDIQSPSSDASTMQSEMTQNTGKEPVIINKGNTLTPVDAELTDMNSPFSDARRSSIKSPSDKINETAPKRNRELKRKKTITSRRKDNTSLYKDAPNANAKPSVFATTQAPITSISNSAKDVSSLTTQTTKGAGQETEAAPAPDLEAMQAAAEKRLSMWNSILENMDFLSFK